ncbi:MAG: DUF2807 domain-containing protein, partial [Bacteroidetes bacterium]|nr:DUF2807 domain-containing protein [Bacteroidota bacterium]
MKTFTTLAASLLFILLIASFKMSSITGSGNIVTQTPDIASFEEIEVANYCDVEVYQDNNYSLQVSEYENLIQYLKFEVVGKKLIISTEPGNISIKNSQAKAVIHMPDALHKLIISGSSNITLKSGFKDISNLYISGSGNIIGEKVAQMNKVNATIAGSGNITMLGTASSVKLNAEGSGKIIFSGVLAQNGSCRVNFIFFTRI